MGYIARLRGQCNRADGRRGLKGFADAPWATLLFHIALQIAPGHIQAHGVTVNVLLRIGSCNVLAAHADGNDQLNFMVQIVGECGVRHRYRFIGLCR